MVGEQEIMSHRNNYKSYLRSSSAARTVDNYLWHFDRFLKALGGEASLSDERKCHDTIIAIMNEMFDNKKANATVRIFLSSVRRFFRKYEDELNVAESKIFKNIENPKQIESLPRYLSTEKMAQVLAVSRNHGSTVYMLILTMYIAGLRSQEVRDLTVDDIDLDKMTIRVKRGKGGKGREIPIALDAGSREFQEIKEYLTYRRTVGSKYSNLFLNRYGEPFTKDALLHNTQQLSKELGFHVNPHMFRHTYATHLRTNGAGLDVIKELLGHANISTTMVYARLVNTVVTETVSLCHPMSKGFADRIAAEEEAKKQVIVENPVRKPNYSLSPGYHRRR